MKTRIGKQRPQEAILDMDKMPTGICLKEVQEMFGRFPMRLVEMSRWETNLCFVRNLVNM